MVYQHSSQVLLENPRLLRKIERLNEARELSKFYKKEPFNLSLKTIREIEKAQSFSNKLFSNKFSNKLQLLLDPNTKTELNYFSILLNKAINTNSLYDFLKYCSQKYISSPQLKRHLLLYENCKNWGITKEGKSITGHYLTTTCSNCNKLEYHRLPCGASMCKESSEHLASRRYHKILSLLADEEHAYLMIRIPEKLKNLKRFNYLNAKNISKELCPLISNSVKEYFKLQIKENFNSVLETGFYEAFHTYSTSTLDWDIHFNILLSLEVYKIKKGFSKKEIIKILTQEYLNSKEYSHDLALELRQVKIQIQQKKKKIPSIKQTRKKLIADYIKFNIGRFYNKEKLKFIDYQKLREIINKNISEQYGEEYTDEDLYIRDAYSKNEEGEIKRASPKKTAGLLSSYINNIPLYSKNIKKIAKDKIIIKLKNTLRSNQEHKTIYSQKTLTHLQFFNKYQQHLLYIEYPSPEKSNKQRISTLRNLRGYGYYSNNSYFSKSYKRREEEAENFKCSNCQTILESSDIGLIVFNGFVLNFAVSILHLGLRFLYKNNLKYLDYLLKALYKYEKPPGFLIPTTQPEFLGEKKKSILNEFILIIKNYEKIIPTKFNQIGSRKILIDIQKEVDFEIKEAEDRDINNFKFFGNSKISKILNQAQDKHEKENKTEVENRKD